MTYLYDASKLKSKISQAALDIRSYAKGGEHRATVSKHVDYLIGACSAYHREFQLADQRLRVPRDMAAADADVLFRLYRSTLCRERDTLRREGSVVSCYYCGIQRGVTLDHYLPRDSKCFPHLSFFVPNLIPSCGACQGSKGTFFPTIKPRHSLYRKGSTLKRRIIENPARRKQEQRLRIVNVQRLIHPYFDTSIDRSKIRMDLYIDSRSGPYAARLIYDKGKGSPQSALFKYHVWKLKIDSRLHLEVRNLWRKLATSLKKQLQGKSLPEIRNALVLHGDIVEGNRGIGSIEALFFFATAQSDDCLRLLHASINAPAPKLSRRRQAM